MNTPARFFLDVERIRALVARNPDVAAPAIRQAIADFDAAAAAGETPVLWIECNQLVVGTVEPKGKK